MKRLIIVEWETGPESGTDEEACQRLELAWNSLMGWLGEKGYVDPSITMEPSVLVDTMRHYADHPSFSLDGGRLARIALGEPKHTDIDRE